MKHLFKLFITVFIVSVMLSACKSNDDKLEKLTLQISMISHQLVDSSSEDEVQRLVDKYESLTKNVPSSLVKLNKEEFMKLNGSKEFITTVSNYFYTLSEVTDASTSNGIDDGLDMLNNILKMESDFEDEDMDNSRSKSKSTSSKNWDKVLDNYEKLMNNIIPIYKKMAAGDLSAMTDATKYYSNFMKLAEELENSEDDMTPEQYERFLDITSKLTTSLNGSSMGIGEISNLFDGLFDEDDNDDLDF